jgi:protein gp37
MADGTAIEWTDATWNPIVGCSVVSPGCTNCYAMKLAGTRLKHTESRKGLTHATKAGPVWNGEVRFMEQWLDQPLRWKRPRRIFVCAHGDLFAENVPDEWVDRVFAVMAVSPRHTFQVLTKRARRMREYLSSPATVGRVLDLCLDWVRQDGSVSPRYVEDGLTGLIVPNVWLGVSAEDQVRADERIPELLATPAAIRFVSAEPLLGPIDFTKISGTTCLARPGACCGDRPWVDALRGIQACSRAGAYSFPIREVMPRGLDWIIVGGESGHDARPMHPDWARLIRNQCIDAGVAFFFKQWGEWTPGENANFTMTRTERVASLWDEDTYGKATWDYGTVTPADSVEMHRDDEPDLYRIGKKRAGRKLDGVEHSAFPETS